MNSHELLREEIKNKAVVHGKVILSSGKEADYYVDLRRITLDHVAAPIVGQVMLDLTKDLDFEAVGGLTLGADPVAPGATCAPACPRSVQVLRSAGGVRRRRLPQPCR